MDEVAFDVDAYAEARSTALQQYPPHRRNTVPEHNCAICKDPLILQNTCTLYCGHQFHSECIEAWASSQDSYFCTCPTCRLDIVPEYVRYNQTPLLPTAPARPAPPSQPRPAPPSQPRPALPSQPCPVPPSRIRSAPSSQNRLTPPTNGLTIGERARRRARNAARARRRKNIRAARTNTLRTQRRLESIQRQLELAIQSNRATAGAVENMEEE